MSSRPWTIIGCLFGGLSVIWCGGVLLLALFLNDRRIDEGPTVLVLDQSRGWGLHRTDVVLIGVAFLPLLVFALVWVLVTLVRSR